ncbi:MAG: PAS domain-containing protein, partial [Rubrivivax sp.]|nr:PAS domain-containing protein [Rubrivivax sp.]
AVNTLLDIGPQHRLQSMRKREMHLAQATLDSLTAQVCVLDEMGLIRSVNEAWRTCDTLLPAGAQDVVEGGDYLAACTAESQRQAPGALAFADALSAILSGRSSSYDGEFARDTQSGRKWFMGRIRQLAADGPLHVVVTHFDITARKLAEQTAQDSDKRWRFAIEGSGDGLWDTVLPGGQTLYSPRFKEMLGFAAADIGSSADEWMGRVHEDDWRTMLPLYRACLDGTTPALQCELRLRCRSGGWKWVLVRGLVVARDDHGAPLRVICTSSDIDARKSAEAARIELQAQLQESQKMEAVGTLASSIAHDFNNIVGAILGNAEVALQELAADDPARPSLTQIHKAGLRARSLVQKILSFSRRRPA